jgi:hypothetical protein
MQSAAKLSVVELSAVMLNVIMQNVMALFASKVSIRKDCFQVKSKFITDH